MFLMYLTSKFPFYRECGSLGAGLPTQHQTSAATAGGSAPTAATAGGGAPTVVDPANAAYIEYGCVAVGCRGCSCKRCNPPPGAAPVPAASARLGGGAKAAAPAVEPAAVVAKTASPAPAAVAKRAAGSASLFGDDDDDDEWAKAAAPSKSSLAASTSVKPGASGSKVPFSCLCVQPKDLSRRIHNFQALFADDDDDDGFFFDKKPAPSKPVAKPAAARAPSLPSRRLCNEPKCLFSFKGQESV
jgi:hypothetical protein